MYQNSCLYLLTAISPPSLHLVVSVLSTPWKWLMPGSPMSFMLPHPTVTSLPFQLLTSTWFQLFSSIWLFLLKIFYPLGFAGITPCPNLLFLGIIKPISPSLWVLKPRYLCVDNSLALNSPLISRCLYILSNSISFWSRLKLNKTTNPPFLLSIISVNCTTIHQTQIVGASLIILFFFFPPTSNPSASLKYIQNLNSSFLLYCYVLNSGHHSLSVTIWFVFSCLENALKGGQGKMKSGWPIRGWCINIVRVLVKSICKGASPNYSSGESKLMSKLIKAN